MEKKVPKFLKNKVQPKSVQQPEQQPEQSQEQESEQPEEQEDSQEEKPVAEPSEKPKEESEETGEEESEDLEEEDEDEEVKEETEEELKKRIAREKYLYSQPIHFNHQLLITLTNVVNSLDSINKTLVETNVKLHNMGSLLEDLPENLGILKK